MSAVPPKPPILIAGPTASGKSALALAYARRDRGVVINADSMQVYRELAILTARPTAEEEAQAPHRLYGHVPAAEAYSVARWLKDVAASLAEAAAEGWRPVIAGGTGLYFKALTEGLSEIPEIPADVRRRWRERAAARAPGDLHAELERRDRVMAARLSPGDRQRVTRALEVIDATGRSLAEWQRLAAPPLIRPEDAVRIVIRPPRAALHARCDRRFDLMLAAGALDEVRGLAAMRLDPDLPAMRALGVPALMAHLDGRMPLADAVALAKLETRQFVKRQETWLKRHMIAWNKIDSIINCENCGQFIQ